MLGINKEEGSMYWRGFPGGSVVKNPPANQCRRHGLDLCVRKIPWKRKWQPTPVFLPRKSRGQRSLASYSQWGCKESDMTEQLNNKDTKRVGPNLI